MDKRFLEDCLAKGMSLPQIGRLVGKDHTTVGYWVKKHGLRANGARKYAPRGGIDREALRMLVEDGFTLAEMAKELDRDISTIRYWMERHGFKAIGQGRRRKVVSGAKFANYECRRHGHTEFVLESSGYYRCKRCRADAVARRRRKVKEILVAEAGGRCIICGYDRHAAGLEFHHVDPSAKSFGLSIRGITRGIDRLRAEAAKCVLLCATCHAEVEAGARELPVKFS
jgi:hypothetical protein